MSALSVKPTHIDAHICGSALLYSEEAVKMLSSDEEEEPLEAMKEWDEFDELLETILLDEFMDLEDEEDEEPAKQWGGSRPRRAQNKERVFVQAHANLIKNYF